jgi:hypothetical protein
VTEPLRASLARPEIDEAVLAQAVALAVAIYARHEAGQPYSAEVRQLSALTGQQVNRTEVHGAFGSVSPETFARSLLRQQTTYPDDLSRPELLQLLNLVLAAEGEEWQHEYWIACIQRSTGCDDLVELIYYPDEYFGDDAPDHDLSAEEILDEAIASKTQRRRRVLITPPPPGSA